MTKLVPDGWQVVKGAISPNEIAQWRPFLIAQSEGLPIVNGQSDTAGTYPARQPISVEVIRRGALLLEEAGYGGVRYASGAIIPKVTGEGRRCHHVDWWAWHLPETWRATPPQAGVLFYFDDAPETAGALIVTPWSNRRWVPEHLERLYSFEPRPDEVAISLQAGDAVLLDSRLMHAVTGPNISGHTRLVVTIWYMLEWDQLSDVIKSTTMRGIESNYHQYLGDLCPAYDGPSTEVLVHDKTPQFPLTLERLEALRWPGSDAQLLGDALQPMDEGRDFTSGNNAYSWYYALGRAKAPRRICEFGVRYGYSLLSMASGACAVGVCPDVHGFDGEIDHPGSNGVALRNIVQYATSPVMHKVDTKTLVPAPPENFDCGCGFGTTVDLPFDIVHVDADHSDQGIVHELQLAGQLVAKDGWIVVDDTEAAHIREAAERFANETQRRVLAVPTLRGMLILY